METLAHAKLSASGAHRWMACAGSVALEADLPEQESTYAAEGTAAHMLAETCLRQEVDADAYRGEEFNGFVVGKEMVEAVQFYLDYVRLQPGKLLVETRVDFSHWVPEGFGTADAIVLHEGKATVIDLKYGKGMQVFAEENPQAMAYAAGCLAEFDFLYDCRDYKLVIVQPRLDHVDEWEVSRDDLAAWADEEFGPAAGRALADDAPFAPGEKQCQWCKGKASCRALADFSVGMAIEGFPTVATIKETGGDIDLKPVAQLTVAEIGAILPHLNLLKKWADAVTGHAVNVLETGGKVPGYKLVSGRAGPRKWDSDADEIAAVLKKAKLKVADIYNKTLVSPTQAEKLLGKTHPVLVERVVRAPGSPTMAPEADKRPALIVDPTEGFTPTDTTSEAA